MPRIYTRTGDDGTTGLLFGGRALKDDPRIEACGAVDEAVAALGLARSLGLQAGGLDELVTLVQRQLFAAGAEVAAGEPKKLEPGVSKVTDRMVQDLESHIDRMVGLAPLPRNFILPGATQASAALDVARGLVRRAERRAVALSKAGQTSDGCLVRYLNRLSDLLFVAARLEESSRGKTAEPSRAGVR